MLFLTSETLVSIASLILMHVSQASLNSKCFYCSFIDLLLQNYYFS